MATNNKPNIMGTDDGIWRRIHLIPFLQKFDEHSKTINNKLKDQLLGELPGILNWCINGARRWLAEGLNPPVTVRAATAAYRNESNPITPFIESCCVLGDHLRMQAGPAFREYEAWFKTLGEPHWKKLTDKAFHAALHRRFKAEGKRQVFYLGVGLATEREPGQEG
jgi:putative DNA primase/helicase